jgi:hypothetical protein
MKTKLVFLATIVMGTLLATLVMPVLADPMTIGSVGPVGVTTGDGIVVDSQLYSCYVPSGTCSYALGYGLGGTSHEVGWIHVGECGTGGPTGASIGVIIDNNLVGVSPNAALEMGLAIGRSGTTYYWQANSGGGWVSVTSYNFGSVWYGNQVFSIAMSDSLDLESAWGTVMYANDFQYLYSTSTWYPVSWGSASGFNGFSAYCSGNDWWVGSGGFKAQALTAQKQMPTAGLGTGTPYGTEGMPVFGPNAEMATTMSNMNWTPYAFELGIPQRVGLTMESCQATGHLIPDKIVPSLSSAE